MSGEEAPEPRGALFGVFLLVVGLFTLLTVGNIKEMSFGANADPGPRALPIALAGCLIFGGAAEIIATSMKRRRTKATKTNIEEIAAPAGASNLLDAGILLGALIIYIGVLPWIGFTLSTLGFAISMMWRLKTGWILNLAVSVGLVVAVHVLFVMVFRVQLPAGELGLPF